MTDIQKQMAEALEMAASLMDEAAAILAAMPPDVLEKIPGYRWALCDELGGAACILRDHRQQEARGPLTWQPIETAPKGGTPILGWCVHDADPYFDEAANRLTDYGARAEGLSHVKDGPHVLVWGDAYEVSDGWENGSYTVPAGWELSTDSEVMANPTHWMPIPPALEAAHGIKGE